MARQTAVRCELADRCPVSCKPRWLAAFSSELIMCVEIFGRAVWRIPQTVLAKTSTHLRREGWHPVWPATHRASVCRPVIRQLNICCSSSLCTDDQYRYSKGYPTPVACVAITVGSKHPPQQIIDVICICCILLLISV